MKNVLRRNNYMQPLLEIIIVFSAVLAFGFSTAVESTGVREVAVGPTESLERAGPPLAGTELPWPARR